MNAPDPRVWSIDGVPAEVWVEPTREQWFLVRVLPRIFGPSPVEEGPFARLFAVVTVVPSTNFTNTSLRYQSYLNDVFHTTRTARVGHAVCMPIVVAAMFAGAEQLGLREAMALVLLAWWTGWAALERDPVWGAALWGTLAALFAASSVLLALGVSPWALLVLAAFLQAASHSPEPMLPPRVTRQVRWVPFAGYLGSVSTLSERMRRLGYLASYSIFGTLDEAIASPRLLPVLVREVLWFAGWRQDERDAWKSVSAAAVASGNPAIDYIGVGGGTRLRPPD